MPLMMERVQSLRNSFNERSNSVRQSSVENLKALRGSFVAAVSAVFEFVAKQFVWAWSKVPAAPQLSLWSRISNALFKPTVPTQEAIEKLQAEKAALEAQTAALVEEKARFTENLESLNAAGVLVTEEAEVEVEPEVESEEEEEKNNESVEEQCVPMPPPPFIPAVEEEKNDAPSFIEQPIHTQDFTPAAETARKKSRAERAAAMVTRRLPSLRKKMDQ